MSKKTAIELAHSINKLAEVLENLNDQEALRRAKKGAPEGWTTWILKPDWSKSAFQWQVVK